MNRKAKIVATIGPASQEEEILKRMILAGLDVARLNFSHGVYEEHQSRIQSIRKLSQALNKPVTILQDLQGPKLRVGDLPPEGIALSVGEKVILRPFESAGHLDVSATVITMDVPNLLKSVRPNNHILMDDGNLEVIVTGVGDDYIEGEVILGGILKSHKGVNLPGAHLDIPPLTGKDIEDLYFGLKNDIDVIAVSFVRHARDIDLVRETIVKKFPEKKNIPIIAKLERPEAIENLEEIIKRADGVMVARGDLAVETSTELVPILQKKIIKAANQYSKIVITATQMLESMITNPRPTRAEASDVANAIFDGSDAVMLSAESASGNYPVDSVEMMSRIILQAEQHFTDWGVCIPIDEPQIDDDAVSISRAARELAHDRNVAGIAVFTLYGRTAILMSKARPKVPILAFTPNRATYQRLGLLWGVKPFLVPFSNTIETMMTSVDTAIISSTYIKPGQQVVIISGFPVGEVRSPNFALLHTIGEISH